MICKGADHLWLSYWGTQIVDHEYSSLSLCSTVQAPLPAPRARRSTGNRPPGRGTALLELKATGTIDAPPPAVFKVLSDYARYKKIMPYTEEVK